jgi:two-component system LytT family sensor kinase
MGVPHTSVLVILLIKLGVITAMASIIARFDSFRRLIFLEQRTTRQKLLFAVVLGVPFMLGVLTRLLAGYQGADLSLEITVLAGLLGGGIVGMLVGMMVSLPAMLIPRQPELLTAPMALLYAVVAGTARWVCPDKEEIWKFSPFIDLSLYRSIKQRFKQPGLDWQVLFSLVCVMLEICRITFGRMAPTRLYFLDPRGPWWTLLMVLFTLIGVGLPLRVWNSTRIQHKLEEQERLLAEARVEALISQINPHFLFNTLNTVSSLIRFDPETARMVLLKLSNILRRRLKTQVHFVSLAQELNFIDDYLDIEVVRFGTDKLRIRKEIDPETRALMVPSMMLQPMVENALQHGIGPKVEGGTITLRTTRRRGRLIVEVIDDGVGISPQRRKEVYDSGIGISNVRARLKALYGQLSAMTIESESGKGTLIRFEIPELMAPEESVPVEAASGL